MNPHHILHFGDFHALCHGDALEELLGLPDFKTIDAIVITGVATIPFPQHFHEAQEKLTWMLNTLKIPTDRCIVTPGVKDLHPRCLNQLGYFSEFFYNPLKETPYVLGIANSTLWSDENALQIIGFNSVDHINPKTDQATLCLDGLDDCIETAVFLAHMDDASPTRFLAWWHPLHKLDGPLQWPVFFNMDVSLILHGDSDVMPTRFPVLGAPPKAANLITQQLKGNLFIRRYEYHRHWQLKKTASYFPKLREGQLK